MDQAERRTVSGARTVLAAAVLMGCGGDWFTPEPLADANGSWDVYMTPDGEAEEYIGVLRLIHKGSEVYEAVPDACSGTVQGNRIELTDEDELAGNPLTLTMVGTVGGAHMGGTWTIDYLGTTTPGTWRAELLHRAAVDLSGPWRVSCTTDGQPGTQRRDLSVAQVDDAFTGIMDASVSATGTVYGGTVTMHYDDGGEAVTVEADWDWGPLEGSWSDTGGGSGGWSAVQPDLVAHWEFDGVGQIVVDSSGYGNHAILGDSAGAESNDPVRVAGKIGGALGFDGGNDRVTVGAPDMPPPWTAAMWVNREDSPAGAAKLLATQSTNLTLRLEQWNDTNKVGFSVIGADYVFDYEAPIGTWAHLAFVCTGSETLLYAGGFLVDTDSHSIDLPAYFIGTQTTDHAAKGLIDDIRIYRRALTAQEVEGLLGPLPPVAGDDGCWTPSEVAVDIDVLQNDSDPNPDDEIWMLDCDDTSAQGGSVVDQGGGILRYQPPSGFSGTDTFSYTVTDGVDTDTATVTVWIDCAPDTDLIAHWEFEGAGQIVTDSSGYAKHGGLGDSTGVEPNDPTWVAGRIGGALKFDGVDDRVTVAAADIPPPWTAAMWVNREDSPAGAAKLLTAPSTNRSLRLEQWNNTNKVGFASASAAYVFDYEAPIGTWAHLVFICTGSETALVVNGVPEDTRPVSIDLPIHFIGTQTTDHTAKGIIDDIRVYSRVLTPAEIQALASMGD